MVISGKNYDPFLTFLMDEDNNLVLRVHEDLKASIVEGITQLPFGIEHTESRLPTLSSPQFTMGGTPPKK